MKNLLLEQYPPLARKAAIFLNGAKVLNGITNRQVGFWEVSYYLLSHALELSIKTIALKETGKRPLRIHDKEILAGKYRKECGFSDEEISAIIELKLLNNGSGGLRYDNIPVGHFLPSTFNRGVKIVERLLEKFEHF
jgi:HEPN domain-containing protein